MLNLSNKTEKLFFFWQKRVPTSLRKGGGGAVVFMGRMDTFLVKYSLPSMIEPIDPNSSSYEHMNISKAYCKCDRVLSTLIQQ